MKALVLTLLLLVSVVGAASAQKVKAHKASLLAELPGNNEIPETQVRALTDAMAKQLHLNEGQYVRMLATNRIKLARLDEIQWQYRDNVAQQHAQLQELQSQYETECSRILTPTQLSLLHESQQPQDTLPKADPTVGGIG